MNDAPFFALIPPGRMTGLRRTAYEPEEASRFVPTNVQKFHTASRLRASQVHATSTSPGYRYDCQIWRIYLRDLLPRLFRD
jgi:hypothetical protein